jgi:hypothetical protein
MALFPACGIKVMRISAVVVGPVAVFVISGLVLLWQVVADNVPVWRRASGEEGIGACIRATYSGRWHDAASCTSCLSCSRAKTREY